MGGTRTGVSRLGGLAQLILRVLVPLAVVGATGCGAAYYGTAIGVYLSTEENTKTDISFPDARPSDPVVPPFVEVDYGTTPTQVTVTRRVGGGFDNGTGTTQSVTEEEITGFKFPPQFGEAISNRDADLNLLDGDRLVIRVDGAASRELTFSASDVASTGTGVATVLQTKIRALASGVTDLNFADFLVTFDERTGTYEFRTGLPSNSASIEFERPVRVSIGDAAPSAASGVTASRLGLGVDNGGIKYDGDQSVRVTVLNSGVDSVGAGTPISLYLSQDKVLDTDEDLPIDTILLDSTILVGESRTFALEGGGGSPLRTLVTSDIEAGKYYLLFDVSTSGGETLLTDNLVNSAPLMVVFPVDDPTTAAVEAANTLDFAMSRTASPISVVMGKTFATSVSLKNYGAASAGVNIDMDLVLSADTTFHSPGGLFDPAGAVAGIYINPKDPSRPVTVNFATGATLGSSLSGDVLSVTYVGGESIAVLISTLNASAGDRIDAFTDGIGTTGAAFSTLVTAAGASSTVATDVFLVTRQVSFPTNTIQTDLTFSLNATIRTTAFQTLRLPLKLRPLFRIRPATSGTVPDNTKNNIREGANYVRVYDPADAFFDAATSTVLPTVDADDFAELEAVSQRPVNIGSIRQGQQRVFRFEIPATGLSVDASQVLVLLRSDDFDTHLDLLSSNGAYIVGSDDSGQGLSSLVYTPTQAASGNRSFYAVVSPARFDESDLTSGDETFELVISVNAQETTDTGLVKAVAVDSVSTGRNQRYDTSGTISPIDNLVLAPISMTNSKAEVMFVLPSPARVRFRTQPVFAIGVETEITQFESGSDPTPVEFQAVLDATASGVVYKPSGGDIGTSHELPAGVYTIAFDGNNGASDPATNLRLEISAEFIPALTD
jgi:hypothetical protein